jgi:hypothetical protein
VLAPLRNNKFTSVHSLNEAMRPLVAALNNRQMRDYGASRQELFDRTENSTLKPLPRKRYEFIVSKLARVNIDYHVEFEKHYYSVPYQLVHQKVWIRVGESQVTVLHNNTSVATHLRSRVSYRYTTLLEHMPANHRAIRSRTAESFVIWASAIGEETKRLVERVFLMVRHEQQAFRSILGMQRLAKTYSPSAFEEAAKEANGAQVASCRAVRGIIARQHSEKLSETQQPPTISHANLRDPDSYH